MLPNQKTLSLHGSSTVGMSELAAASPLVAAGLSWLRQQQVFQQQVFQQQVFQQGWLQVALLLLQAARVLLQADWVLLQAAWVLLQADWVLAWDHLSL